MLNFKTKRMATLASITMSLGLVGAHSASAEQACDLCNKQVVTNSALAACFLQSYPQLSQSTDAVVVVDLSACAPMENGFEALPSPLHAQDGSDLTPDVQFMVSKPQLDCLKRRIELPGLVLDPVVRIELASCG